MPKNHTVEITIKEYHTILLRSDGERFILEYKNDGSAELRYFEAGGREIAVVEFDVTISNQNQRAQAHALAWPYRPLD